MMAYESNASVPHLLVEQYYHYFIHHRDKRADNLPLMNSSMPTIFICSLYAILVFYGPRYMKHRPALNIKPVLIAYNTAQTLFSLYGFIQGWSFYVSGDYSWLCEPVDYSTNEQAIRALNMSWCFYISKLVDMLDTLFFVVQKK